MVTWKVFAVSTRRHLNIAELLDDREIEKHRSAQTTTFPGKAVGTGARARAAKEPDWRGSAWKVNRQQNFYNKDGARIVYMTNMNFPYRKLYGTTNTSRRYSR